MIADEHELFEKLAALPEDTPWGDIRKRLKTVGVGGQEDFERWVDELMNQPDTGDPRQEKVAFGAFCIRVGRLRRNKDRTRETQVMNQYRTHFCWHPFYNYLDLMRLLDMEPEKRAQEVLELAEENRNAMPGNAGVHHALAIAVADIFEVMEFLPEKKKPAAK